MDKSVIYVAWCICHPEDGIRYVGQTSKGMNSRSTVHFWNARTETSTSYRSPMSNWIRKHGEANIAFTVLEVCGVTELNEREKRWIALFRSEGYRLVNILEGGDQPRGHKRPEHSRRMSGQNNPMYGQDRSELMRKIHRPPSKATRDIWSENRTGSKNANAKLTEDQVRDIRSRYDGKWPYGAKTVVAKEFGVTPQMIHHIVHRKSWTHIR